MSPNPSNTLSHNDLTEIRDAVPALDLLAIRSLRRAGFEIVRQNSETGTGERHQAQGADWMRRTQPNSSAA